MTQHRAHNWYCFENIEARQPYAVIYTSLGCPYNCAYCPIQAFYGKPGIRFRRPEKVIEEIDLLVKNYQVKNFKIMDELFVLKKERVRDICDRLIQRNYQLNIWCYARVDLVEESLLKKMKKAGINWIAYGLESINERIRENVAKKFSQEKIKEAIAMTRRAGIFIIANFIFGLPEDNYETMQETLNMAKEFNFEYVNFYTAMAYSGSKLYQSAIKKGLKLPKEWSGFGQYSEDSLPLPTQYLSSREVLEFRDKAFEEYYTNPGYLDSIVQKFGQKTLNHIKEMVKHKIKRKFI